MYARYHHAWRLRTFDKLTWREIGARLGVSRQRAEQYGREQEYLFMCFEIEARHAADRDEEIQWRAKFNREFPKTHHAIGW